MTFLQKIQDLLDSTALRIGRELYIVDAQGYVMAASRGDLPQAGDMVPIESEWEKDTLWDEEHGAVYSHLADGNGNTLYLCVQAKAQQDEHYAYLIARMIEGALAGQSGKQGREDILADLLLGRYSNDEVDYYAQELHLALKQNHCVLLLEIQAERMDTVRNVLMQATLTRREDLIVPLSTRQVALVMSLRLDDDTQEMRQLGSAIAETLENEYQLPCTIGIGLVKSQMWQMQESLREAQQAVRMGRLQGYEGPVYAYSDYLMEFFLKAMPHETMQRYYNQVQGQTVTDVLQGEMEATVRAFFINSLNVSETARQLCIHRNTLLYRLDKIQRSTGMDLRNFEHAVIFKLLMQIDRELSQNE